MAVKSIDSYTLLTQICKASLGHNECRKDLTVHFDYFLICENILEVLDS